MLLSLPQSAPLLKASLMQNSPCSCKQPPGPNYMLGSPSTRMRIAAWGTESAWGRSGMQDAVPASGQDWI